MLGKAFQYIRIIFPVFFLLNGSVAFAQASFEGLGDLASGLFSNSAWGVSGDSSVVVGDAISDSGTQAFRWQNDVMPPLGDLPGGNFFSFAQRVSGDGSVVVARALSQVQRQKASVFRSSVLKCFRSGYGSVIATPFIAVLLLYSHCYRNVTSRLIWMAVHYTADRFDKNHFSSDCFFTARLSNFPLLPAVFLTKRMSPIVIFLSTALHIS